MKHICGLLFFVSFSLLLIAQPLTEVRKASNIRYEGIVLNSAVAGNWVFWSEYSGSSFQLLSMRYNNFGHALFSEPLCINLSEGPIKPLQVVESSDGNIVLLYLKQIDNYSAELRMQKINTSGEFLWQEDGIELCQNADFKFPDARICANNSGGAYAVFFNEYDNGRIYGGVNIDNSGNNIWTANPYLAITQSHRVEQLLLDDDQNLIINISRFQGQSYIFKVDSSGAVIGSNPLFESTAPIPYSTMICQGSDGEMLLYSDCEYSNLPMQLQMVDSNGDLLLDEPLEIINNEGYIGNIQFEATNDGEYFCSYILSYATGVSPFALVTAKLNSNLEQVWGDSLNIVYGDEEAIMDQDMLIDAEGNGWITFLTHVDYNDYEVKLVKVDAAGSFSSPSTPITADTQKKEAPRIIGLDNLIMLVWKDYQGNQVAMKRQIFDAGATALLPQHGLSLSSMLSGTTFPYEFHSLGDRSICIWDDNRNNQHKLYYQVLDQYLNPLLAENGIELATDSDNCQLVTAAVSPQNTLTFIAQHHNQDGTYSIFMQEIDANGNILYPGNGVQIDQSDMSYSLTLSFDGEARLIYWIDYLTNSSYRMIVNGQRIISGVATWGSEGICVYNVEDEDIEDISATSQYLLILVQNRGTYVRNVQALSLQADGSTNPGWPEYGIKLLDDEYNSYQERIRAVGTIGEDLYCVIGRTAVNATSIVVQKVNPTGDLAWGNSGLSIVSSADSFPDYIDTIISDTIYQAYYLPNHGSFLQKIDVEGNLLFGTQGISLLGHSIMYLDRSLLEFDNGNILFSWLSYQSNSEYTLINTYITPEGETLETLNSRTSKFNTVIPALVNDSCVILSAESSYDIFGWGEEQLTSLYAFSIPTPLAIDDPVDEAAPAVRLLQNYPNPFKGATTIACKAAVGAPVELRIYNLKGQLITKFEAQPKADGEYSFSWDGRDAKGNLCAAGMYLYKLKTGRFSASKKMILLR